MKAFRVTWILTTEDGSTVLLDDKNNAIRIVRAGNSHSAALLASARQVEAEYGKLHRIKVQDIPKRGSAAF
jgi:hypothetical protein